MLSKKHSQPTCEHQSGTCEKQVQLVNSRLQALQLAKVKLSVGAILRSIKPKSSLARPQAELNQRSNPIREADCHGRCEDLELRSDHVSRKVSGHKAWQVKVKYRWRTEGELANHRHQILEQNVASSALMLHSLLCRDPL